MGKDFLRRDYPLTLVENSLIRALRLNREDLLTEKPKNIKNTDDSLFAITTYHPSFNSFRNIITNNWPLLNRSNNTKRLHDQRIIFGHRRNKNLRELLTQAKVEYPKKPKNKILNAKVTNAQPKIADTVQRYTPRAVSLVILVNDHTRGKSER